MQIAQYPKARSFSKIAISSYTTAADTTCSTNLAIISPLTTRTATPRDFSKSSIPLS